MSEPSSTATSAGRRLEIERKFVLRRRPSPRLLDRHGERQHIEQTYLRSPAGSERRLRRVTRRNGSVAYTLTVKSGAGLVREELEVDLSAEEYVSRLDEREPDSVTLRKSRWQCHTAEGILEVDLYEEFELAVVEVELTSPEDNRELPAWLGEVIEVTGDDRYSNRALARQGSSKPWTNEWPG